MRRKYFDIAFNIKPLVYAMIYLLLIPTFALIYSFLPDNFYYSTAKLENELIDQKANDILKLLKEQILTQYKLNNDSVSKLININYFKLSSLKYENDKFFFSLCDRYPRNICYNERDVVCYWISDCYDLSFPSEYKMIYAHDNTTVSLKEPGIKTVRAIHIVENKTNTEANLLGDKLEIDSNKLFKDIFFAKYYNSAVLIIDLTLDNKLNEYKKSITGFPSGWFENLLRMLYLSSVTVTTLGYGDIVPITNMARTLIALEAIFGIIFIGLFLNALSKRNN